METATPASNKESKDPSVKTKRHRGRWGGAILVLLGLVFLAHNFGYSVLPQNWWAGFILLAAASSFWRAWVTFREEKRVTHAVRGQVMGGLITGLVAVIFLLELDWSKMWPLFLVLAGFSAVLYPKEHPQQHKNTDGSGG